MFTPVFLEFAVTAAFNIQEFQDFINKTRDEERQKEQILISNRHNDTNPHTDENKHTNQTTYNQYSQHSNSGTPHTDRNIHTDYTGSHNNYTPHTDEHTNRTWKPHEDNPKAHYNIPAGTHTDTHENAWTHINNGQPSGQHSNKHINKSTHANGYAHYDRYGQDNYHTNTWGKHTNYYPHTDYNTHTNYPSTHSNTTKHTDTRPHTNQNQHTDYTTHTDVGFDHDDYVPSSPAFYVPYTRLKGDVIIGLYSYDKNTDGYGTQDARSKTVYYDLYIRRVKNIDGTPNVSQWVPLLVNQIQDKDGAVTYTLNTIDPLKVGNTKVGAYDGYYEIKAVARNQSLNGVKFESPEKIITVLIQQNSPPEITVQNGAEFINFIFGFDGALTTANVYKPYGSLYADGKIPVHTNTTIPGHTNTTHTDVNDSHIDVPGDHVDEIIDTEHKDYFSKHFNVGGHTDSTHTNTTPTQHNDTVQSVNAQHGIFVKFTMLDEDNPNWQKGQIYLVDENGIPITGTIRDIIWENGSTVISSNGTSKTGYGYIPKESYTALNKSMKNLKVVIKVQDYTDAQCTIPAGAAVIQTTVSNLDPTQMIVHLDLTPPKANLVGIQKQEDKSKIITYNFVDDYPDPQKGIKNGGIKEAKYALTKSTVRPTSWNPVSNPAAAQTVISEEGIWYLHYYASDMLLNEVYGYFGPIMVDKTAPVLEVDWKPQSSTSVVITAKATDNLSGVKYIALYEGTKLINSYSNTGNTDPFAVTFTVPAVEKTYKVVAEDNEGNTAEKEVAVILLDIVNNTTKTTYAAGEAMRISVISPQAERVTAQVWYSKNEFVNTNVTDLVRGANGEWHTRQGGSEGYDKVVIIPKDTKDGTYNVVVTAYRGSLTKTITIPITVKNTIYDYYKSTINK